MNDTLGFIYDTETAVHFAHVTTGIDQEICQRVIHSRDRFHLAMKIIPNDDDFDREHYGTTGDKLRWRYPTFFSAERIRERCVDPWIERAFIVLDTDIDENVVRQVIDADMKYMHRIGIVGSTPTCVLG